MFKNRKGFTLIELLIVITIIGILAVAFLPTLLGAPARGRDTQRIADLQKLQKVMIDADLENTAYPDTDTCLAANSADFLTYKPALGGSLPIQPSDVANITVDNGVVDCDSYMYVVDPTADYSIGLYTRVENMENGNAICSELAVGGQAALLNEPTSDDDACYVILMQ